MWQDFFYNLKLGILFAAFCLLFFGFGAFTITFTPAGKAWAKEQHAPSTEQTTEHIKANFAKAMEGVKPASTKHLPNAIKYLLKEER